MIGPMVVRFTVRANEKEQSTIVRSGNSRLRSR